MNEIQEPVLNDGSKKENWVNKVDTLVKQAEDWSQLRQMMVNVNYYVGQQWIGWNRETRRVVELPREPGVERITLNKIRPRVLTLLSKHTKNKIKYDVIPASKEQRDIDAAKAADKFIQFLWQELNMSQRTAEVFLNNLVKGWCAAKVWFDPNAGQEITPVQGEPGFAQGMAPVHMGELRIRICDPMTLFIDPSATCDEEIRWMIEKKARDVDEIEVEYGVKVAPDANIDSLNHYDVTRVDQWGIGHNDITRHDNMAFVYEMWHKPCKKYPQGLKATVAGGKQLDLDEAAGNMPYTVFGYQPIPGTVRFDALVKDMIPVQRGINIKRSMMATHARRLGNAMWLVPLGSGVDEEEITDEAGGIVHYTPIGNMKPERAVAPDIPTFYDRDLAQDAVDLDDMSGAREVSQGRMPSGLDTLGGLEIMVEQENEKLTVAANNYEQGMKKVMRRMLVLLKKHYTEERQARILGDDNDVEIFAFNGAELSGGEDVLVVQGSSLPEMKAAQQERIMLMWKSNAIVKKDGMPDHQTLLRLMGLGDSTELFEQTQLDENKAKLENKYFEDMAQNPQAYQEYMNYYTQSQTAEQINAGLDQAAQMGEMVPPDAYEQPPSPAPGMPNVRDFQDHEVHLYAHNLFRKSSAYDELPPEVQKLLDAHVAQHEQMLAAPMMAEMQMMQDQQNQQGAMAQQQTDQQAQAQSAQTQQAHQNQMQLKQTEHQNAMQKERLKVVGNLAGSQMKAQQRGG